MISYFVSFEWVNKAMTFQFTLGLGLDLQKVEKKGPPSQSGQSGTGKY
jgi:hypothetical protein